MYLYKDSFSPYCQIIYYVDEKRTRKSTRKKIKSEALVFLSEFKEHLKKKKKIKYVTFSEFQKEYEQFVFIKSKSYQKSVSTSFNQLKKNLSKDILLKDIKYRELEMFLNKTFNNS